MSPTDLPQLLDAARSGDESALQEIVRRYQPWLNILAGLQVGKRFRSKFTASDVVQQTLLEAHRALPDFRGRTEAELVAWLKQILLHVLAHEVRRFDGAEMRDLARERSLEEVLADSSQRLGGLCAASGSSPSRKASAREQEVLLAEVLARLPDEQREVILLRHFEGLSHKEIAIRMNRGEGAVRMLWIRALARLREEMGEP